MIRFKKNVDTMYGFMQIGTIKSLPESVEKDYIKRDIAAPYELQRKEEKADIITKELKTEPMTKENLPPTQKRRGRKPRQ